MINTAATESTPATVGIASLQDEATVSGGYLPGGTIQFSLTSPDGSTVSIGSPVTVNGDGTYDSVTVTATEAGNYQWHASYSGDSNNSPASDQGERTRGSGDDQGVSVDQRRRRAARRVTWLAIRT